MYYFSGRSREERISFKEATLRGLAPDGGLYIPNVFPSTIDWESLKGAPYQTVAMAIIKEFTGDTVRLETLEALINKAYGERFVDSHITPLVSLSEQDHVLELFHGPTLAFKDVALQLLGQFFDHFTDEDQRTMTILGATSGDTGSAAIEGVRALDRVKIVMLHPYGRVSDVQRRQMTTVQSPNVLNIAIDGTFDDCQALVKAAFGDPQFVKDVSLGAVNSINWARVLAQTVYYATTCLTLGLPEEGVSFSVPTGNFGDIYAGYIARAMGLPVKDLVVAANKNDILVRAHETGRYDRGDVAKTLSPSMDIQVSSNFERFLSHNTSAEELTELMADFKASGEMGLPEQALAAYRRDFKADRVTDEDTKAVVREVFETYDYAMDPHTAIGFEAGRRQVKDGLRVTLATAHPAKFPVAMCEALGDMVGQQVSALPERVGHIMDGDEHYERLAYDLPSLLARVRDFAG